MDQSYAREYESIYMGSVSMEKGIHADQRIMYIAIFVIIFWRSYLVPTNSVPTPLV